MAIGRIGARVIRVLARMVPGRIRPRLVAAAGELGRNVTRLLHDRRVLRECAVWAVANWCCDAASLWLFLAAFGVRLDPVAVLLVYALGNSAGLLPVTPGGLGLVEGFLIPGLIVYGAPATATLLGVLSWRLFEFWLPIPVGGIAYLSLRAEARFAPSPSPGSTRRADRSS